MFTTEFFLKPALMIWRFVLMCFDYPYIEDWLHVFATGCIALLFWIGVAKFVIALIYKLLDIDSRHGGQ